LINVRKRKAGEEELNKSKASLEQKVQELRTSKKQLSLIYDSIADILFYIKVEPDDCFRFLSVNDAFLKATGLTPDQIAGKRVDEIIPEPSIQMVLDNYKKAINENRIVRWEETAVYPSGERIGDVSIAPILDEQGICTHLVGTVHDITENRQAEKTIRDSEERYELAITGSAAGIWDWDIPTNELYTSERLKELWGYVPDEIQITMEDFWNRLHPADSDAVKNALEQHLKNRDNYNIDYRVRTKSGEYRWFHARGQALWDNTGKAIRMSGSLTDITPRKMAEEDLVKSEEHFRSIMEQSPIPMELLTPDGKINQVNPAWLQLWNTNEEGAEEVLEKYNMLTDPQLTDIGIHHLVEKAFSGEHIILPPIQYDANLTVTDFEIENLEGLKSPWIQCHLYPIKDANGELEYVVNTYMDITDLKYAEKETQDQKEMLARVGRTSRMGQLTGSIAHELSQPLTGILSNAQAAELMLNNDRWESEEIKDIIGEIIADVKRCGDVIRNLRDLYREQKGKFDPVDINIIVEESIQLLHSEFIFQHVILAKECTPTLPKINGNAIQLQQVLVNLIMNGIQTMSDLARGDRHLLIGTAFDKKNLTAWVEDNGPGIPVDKIDNIFEPLATWKPGGTGMGLAISNSIIETHGGKMWAENKPEGGARVGFTLPVTKAGQ
jgi:PAS domain S-box-containing protein